MDNKTDYETMTKDDLRAEVEARMERLDLAVVGYGSPDEVSWWVIQGHVPLALARLAILETAEEDSRPEHCWLCKTGDVNEECGELVERCAATADGAFPVTLADSGAVGEALAMSADDLRELLEELDTVQQLTPVSLDEAEALITSGRAQ